jgi:hypothetical protein
MEFEAENKELVGSDLLKVTDVDHLIQPKQSSSKKKQVYDSAGQPLDQSYESMASDEKDPIHYQIESDNEPPQDEVGD